MPTIKILGVHPLGATEEIWDQSVTQRHGLIGLDLNVERRETAYHEVRDELSRVVLIELVVKERDRSMYMGDFGQTISGDSLGPNDEVAYGEVFLGPAGDRIVANFLDEIEGDLVRVAFFLHEFKPNRPLLTSYGPVETPLLTAMPPRLQRLVPYTPPPPM